MKQLEPNVIYTGAELSDIVGKTAYESMSKVAYCKNHYLGSAVLDYLHDLSLQKMNNQLALDSAANCSKKTTDRIKNRNTKRGGTRHGIKESRTNGFGYDPTKFS